MNEEVQPYIDALPDERKPLFDKLQALKGSVIVVAIAVVRDTRRFQKADLVVIPQSARRHAGDSGDLFHGRHATNIDYDATSMSRDLVEWGQTDQRPTLNIGAIEGRVSAMKAVVVYESLWGNTAAIARAIADGIGPEAQALSTSQASGEAIAGADLIIAGAPLFGFRLPTEQARENIRKNPGKGPAPDLSQPSMRSWLAALPKGNGRAAAFETRFRWSPGGATGAIVTQLERAGYRRTARDQRFIVKGKYGPLRDGELERAKAWGAELARLCKAG